MRKTLIVGAAVVLAVALMGSTGCRRVPISETPSGRSRVVSTDTTQVARGLAERLETTVAMGVGELALAGADASSTDALAGTFRYAPSAWKPDVEYSVAASTGVLLVSQPTSGVMPDLGHSENQWTLKLDPTTPTKLSLTLGVGESDVDLSRVNLTGLEVATGVGSAKVDLTGARTSDLSPRIECGVGEVDLRVPLSVPVRIIGGNAGLGDLTADGFQKDGSDLVNEAWRQEVAGPKLEITIKRGVGDVTIVSAD